MVNISIQNAGSTSNSLVVQTPGNGSSPTSGGINQRFRGKDARGGGLSFKPDDQKIRNVYRAITNRNVQKLFQDSHGDGSVLIPFDDEHSDIIRQFQGAFPRGIVLGLEANNENPEGLLVPAYLWNAFIESGRNISSLGSLGSPYSMMSPGGGSSLRPRFSTGSYGHWVSQSGSLGARKKNFGDEEWKAAVARKREQSSLADRKAQVYAMKKQHDLRMAKLSPFGFLYRTKARVHGKLSKFFGHRSQQHDARREKLLIDREAAILRGNTKDWRDASLSAGASRGDSRIRGVLRTLRAS